MDNNDSSFAILIMRDPKEELILDQEEEPISYQEDSEDDDGSPDRLEGDGGSHEDSIHFNSDQEADEMTHFAGDDRYDSSQSAPTSADEDAESMEDDENRDTFKEHKMTGMEDSHGKTKKKKKRTRVSALLSAAKRLTDGLPKKRTVTQWSGLMNKTDVRGDHVVRPRKRK
ncbi:hypothetical protein Tco_0827787 [Tanacetum coccineum]